MGNFGTSRPSSKVSESNAMGMTKKFWAMSIPAAFLLFPTLCSPTLSVSGIFPYRSHDYPLRILSSQDSVTGVVVVGELLPPEVEMADPTILHSIRYLRASHSLLGGVWIGSGITSLDGIASRTDQAGIPLGDSIYSTFILQEAVRLVSRNPESDIRKREDALIM